MDVVGYALIKSDATSITSPIGIEHWINCPVRVLEFSFDGSILALNSKADSLAMIDVKDIKSSFECKVVNNLYIVAPNLSFIEESLYVGNCLQRKGGYNTIVRDMVVAASLHSGKFNDSFLWQKAGN